MKIKSKKDSPHLNVVSHSNENSLRCRPHRRRRYFWSWFLIICSCRLADRCIFNTNTDIESDGDAMRQQHRMDFIYYKLHVNKIIINCLSRKMKIARLAISFDCRLADHNSQMHLMMEEIGRIVRKHKTIADDVRVADVVNADSI